MWSVAISVSVLLLQTLVINQYWRAQAQIIIDDPREEWRHFSLVLARISVAYLVACLIGMFVPAPVFVVAALAALAAWTVYETMDFTSFHYFGLSPVRVVRSLPVQPGDEGAGSNVLTYIRQYVSPTLPAGLFLLAATDFLLIDHVVGPWPLAWLLTGLAAAAAVIHLALRRRKSTLIPRDVEALFLKLDAELPYQPLQAVDRSGAACAVPEVEAAADHIVLIILESAGDDTPASHDANGLMAEQIRHMAGHHPLDWVRPANVVTGSSCTEVSIPVIMTGCGPHETAEKLNAMPTLFDLARQRGMRTMFFTSSSLRWAGFDKFFSGPSIDRIYSADTAGLPHVNDLCGDDYVVAQELAEAIRATDEKLCIVAYFNALHVPFQNESACAFPDWLYGRKARAAHIVESAHMAIVDALKATGRYEDTLIVTVGDHGEIAGNDGLNTAAGPSRLNRLSRTVLQPVFLIKPPARLPEPLRYRLHVNAKKLVSTIDIAPTVAGMLGVELAAGLSYLGADLCGTVPQDRVLYTLNVNEWRKWPVSAVAISQDKARIVIDYQNMDSLCTDPDGAPMKATAKNDKLLLQALEEPIVQKSISKTFRDKIGIDYDPKLEAGMDLILRHRPGREASDEEESGAGKSETPAA